MGSLAETASGAWVFPGKGGDEPLGKNVLYWFWIKARNMAGIVADAGLHDLRHTHASYAVMNGRSLHIAGRLFGHQRASTTNHCVHLDDATLSQAAERVALAIQRRRCPADGKCGTAEQWIKESKQAVKMTRLSCYRFRSNEMRLW